MSNRHLRRAAAKQQQQVPAHLARALHGLQELTGTLRDAIPEAGRDLATVQNMVREWRATAEGFRYQLERQRAVFLRMMRDVGTNPTFDYENVLAVEETYGAEYDALQFLCWVVMLGTTEEGT
jgi:alanyl-tRNA synthetase